VIVAYNADFDVNHVKVMFSRHGIPFEACFNAVVIDPMKTAKNLVNSKTIITKILTKAAAPGRKGANYSSAKLEDVAEALGVEKVKDAHRALADVETLLEATRRMFKLMFSKSMFESSINFNRLSHGTSVNLIIESPSDGLKARPVKVLKNDFDQKQIVFIDLLDYQRIGLSPSNLKTVSYCLIFDEVELDQESQEKLESIFQENQNYYVDRVK
jgi:hypothetical protein